MPERRLTRLSGAIVLMVAASSAGARDLAPGMHGEETVQAALVVVEGRPGGVLDLQFDVLCPDSAHCAMYRDVHTSQWPYGWSSPNLFQRHPIGEPSVAISTPMGAASKTLWLSPSGPEAVIRNGYHVEYSSHVQHAFLLMANHDATFSLSMTGGRILSVGTAREAHWYRPSDLTGGVSARAAYPSAAVASSVAWNVDEGTVGFFHSSATGPTVYQRSGAAGASGCGVPPSLNIVGCSDSFWGPVGVYRMDFTVSAEALNFYVAAWAELPTPPLT